MACVLIVPNAVLVGLRLGAPKVARFVVLNVSMRICRYFFSANGKFLLIDISTFLATSRRRLPNCSPT